MSPEQSAAFVFAQASMMNIEAEEMRAENAEREQRGASPAYGSTQWALFRERWEPVLGYNAILSLYRQ